MKVIKQITVDSIAKRVLPKNYKNDHYQNFKQDFERIIPSAYLLKTQLSLINSDGLVIDILSRTILSNNSKERISIFRLIKFLLIANYSLIFSSRLLMVLQKWNEAYFHWLTDIVPKIYLLKNYSSRYSLIIPRNLDQVNLEAIQHFDFRYKKIKANKIYFTVNLFYVSPIAPPGNYNEDVIRSVRNHYFAEFNIMKRHNKNRCIFISRKNAHLRRISNESEIITFLKHYNIEIHALEEYNFDEQVRLLSDCSLIIGMHGGGLTNMLFMNENQHVLEIRPPYDEKLLCYYSLASALNINYWYLFALQNPSSSDSFYVDPVKFKMLLKEILRSK